MTLLNRLSGCYVNGDVTWIMIRSDVKFEGTRISQARLGPSLFGVGIGYRFNGGYRQVPLDSAT